MQNNDYLKCSFCGMHMIESSGRTGMLEKGMVILPQTF